MSLHISDERRCEIISDIAKVLSSVYPDKSVNDIYYAIENYDILALVDDALNYGLQDE